jgi:hypothetical protein
MRLRKKPLQRTAAALALSMCMSVCYSSILEGKPDNIDAMKPVLYDIIRRALSPEK